MGGVQSKQQQQQQQQQQPFNLKPISSEAAQKTLRQYEKRDETYQAILDTQYKRHVEIAQEKKKVIEQANMERRIRSQNPTLLFGPGYQSFGNGKTGFQHKIKYPGEKRRRQQVRFSFSTEAVKEQAEKEECLVPIRIDLEIEGYKLRDTFTWNLNESLITFEQFAEVICLDLRLPLGLFVEPIAKSIKEQLEDYNLSASNPQETEELKTIVKLDITVGNRELIDQFEWDISCPKNSPEEFAERLVKELGLGGEFKTAIAHLIREQIHVYKKSLLVLGEEEQSSQEPSYLTSALRDHQITENFTPAIIELTDAMIERMEKDQIRESRRKRRGARSRRNVVTSNDMEPQKTHRTGFAAPPEQELTDEQYLAGIGYDNNGQSHYSTQRKSAIKARLVTGIKKEGRVPHVVDERPDNSVKIVVLDLRNNDDPSNIHHHQPESKFKKMSLDFWENVVRIIRAYKPNQPTDCAIQTFSNTIDVYTNIVPARQPIQQQPQPIQQQQAMMNPAVYNPGMFHPMYTNNNSSPILFNQPNYLPVMTAAQYIMNAAAAYNSMLSQPPYALSPILSPQPQHAQIKRKPVQYRPPPMNVLSPQLSQRIQRKKLPAQQQQKKKVRFEEVPTLYTYEPEVSEEEQEEDEDHHYTQPSSSHDRYMSPERPWSSSNIILNNRHPHFDDDYYDDDEEEDEEEEYGDLWRKRYFLRRHDSLGHRPPPVRRSRV
ncbi:hypothetical protein G6F57_002035 [Rhizopus arrhizus]|nr:hypothetical protein G6F57_002035 [Rhizopus arrhizus]